MSDKLLASLFEALDPESKKALLEAKDEALRVPAGKALDAKAAARAAREAELAGAAELATMEELDGEGAQYAPGQLAAEERRGAQAKAELDAMPISSKLPDYLRGTKGQAPEAPAPGPDLLQQLMGSIPNKTDLPDYLRGTGTEEAASSPSRSLAKSSSSSSVKTSSRGPASAPAASEEAPAPDQVQQLIANLYGEGLGDEDIKRAMKLRDDRKLMATLSSLGTDLAADLSRGTVKKDSSFYDNMIKDAGQGVEDIKTRREGKDKELTRESSMLKLGKEKDNLNPNSQASIARRAMYEDRIPSLKNTPGWAQMSAYDIESSKDLIMLQERAQQRAHEAAMKREDRSAASEAKEELKALGVSQADANKLLGSPAYKKYETIDSSASSIEMAVKTPGPMRDIAAIYDFIKLIDPESAVKQGEVDLVKLGRSWPKTFVTAIEKGMTGQTLNVEELKEIYAIANDKRRIQREIFMKHAAPTIAKHKILGTKDSLYLPDGFSSEQEPKSKHAGKEVDLPKKYAPGSVLSTAMGKVKVNADGKTGVVVE